MPGLRKEELKRYLDPNKLPALKAKLYDYILKSRKDVVQFASECLVEMPWAVRRIERLEEGLKIAQVYIHENQCDHEHCPDCLLLQNYLNDFL